MNDRLDILPLTPDSPRVATVAAWQFEQWHHLSPELSFADWLAQLRRECGSAGVPSVFLALLDGQAVGTASLVAQDMSLRPRLTPWLASVYVRPDWRGQGIAARLVRRVEDEARAAGVARCHLFTPDQQSLYRRLGWQERETLDYRGETVTIMTRSLV